MPETAEPEYVPTCCGPSCTTELPDGRWFCSTACLDEWVAERGNNGKHKRRRAPRAQGDS